MPWRHQAPRHYLGQCWPRLCRHMASSRNKLTVVYCLPMPKWMGCYGNVLACPGDWYLRQIMYIVRQVSLMELLWSMLFIWSIHHYTLLPTKRFLNFVTDNRDYYSDIMSTKLSATRLFWWNILISRVTIKKIATRYGSFVRGIHRYLAGPLTGFSSQRAENVENVFWCDYVTHVLFVPEIHGWPLAEISIWDPTKTGRRVIPSPSSGPNCQMASVSHSKPSFSFQFSVCFSSVVCCFRSLMKNGNTNTCSLRYFRFEKQTVNNLVVVPIARWHDSHIPKTKVILKLVS